MDNIEVWVNLENGMQIDMLASSALDDFNKALKEFKSALLRNGSVLRENTRDEKQTKLIEEHFSHYQLLVGNLLKQLGLIRLGVELKPDKFVKLANGLKAYINHMDEYDNQFVGIVCGLEGRSTWTTCWNKMGDAINQNSNFNIVGEWVD